MVTSTTSKPELTEIVEKWVRAKRARCSQHLITLGYVCPMCQNPLCVMCNEVNGLTECPLCHEVFPVGLSCFACAIGSSNAQRISEG